MMEVSKVSVPSDVAPEGLVCVVKAMCVDIVNGGEVECPLLLSEEICGDLVDVAEADINVSSKKGTSVLETSVEAPVDTLEKTVFVSILDLFS